MPPRTYEEELVRQDRIWLGIAWALYAVSWFLPVAATKEMFGGIDAGWKAFLLSVSMAIKPDQHDSFWGLCVAGVFANVLVALSPWILTKEDIPLWYVVALTAAAAMHLSWVFIMRDTHLLTGYYLWVLSIVLLGALASRKHRRYRVSRLDP